MRSFFASLLCMLILIVTWGFYSNFSDQEIHKFTDIIEYSILIDVENSNWEQANDKFELLEEDWHKYKKLSCLFFSTDKINDADYSIARAKYYIKSKDVSNSSGELSCLKEQLTFLHDNEKLTFANVL